MVIGIGSKNANNFLNKFLKETTKKQNDLFAQLSSGTRKLNGSELAVVADLEASVQTLGQASRNVGDISSALQIAEGSLEQAGNITTRLNELAVQAANGTLDDGQRTSLATEFNELKQELARIEGTTEFNGQNLFEQGQITGQVGINGGADSQITAQISGISDAVSSLDSLDISTQAGAQAALDVIPAARDSITQARGNIGASQVRLEAADQNIQQAIVTNAEAAATIRDLDIANATAQNVRNSILQKGNVAVGIQANKLSADTVLKLIS